MPSEYEQTVATLYQAAPEAFVAERQRLAAELKANGDKTGAAKVGKLARPALSAWVVNQLWWHARADFEELFATAKQLRAGKLSASAAHRQAVAKLATRAQRLLSEAGHPANDATLRRVSMTLSGLAAAGGFEPDQPGALAKDREPAGFDAFGATASDELEVEKEPKSKPHHQAAATHASAASKAELAKQRAHEHQVAERARRDAAALKKREAEAHARHVVERREANAALSSAKAELAKREGERSQAAKALAAAEHELERARAAVERAEQRVAALKGEE